MRQETFTTLHSFSGSPGDGANPVAALVQRHDGNFYGTTPPAANHFQGVVFSISQGLPIQFCTRLVAIPGEGAGPFLLR